MVAAVPEVATSPTGSRDAQRQQTRAKILEAVLEIVVEEGMRAVRHRAVAERAGVSLGSTTYHFSGIEELIICAFDAWRSRRDLQDNPFYQSMVELLAPFEPGVVPVAERGQVGARVLELSVGYLVDQLTDKREDRIVELAFYHESMRYPSMREVVLQIWQGQQQFLQGVHLQMGSRHAEADAAITSLLFRQLEQTCLMSEVSELDQSLIRRTLHRHMSLCLELELPLESKLTQGRQDGS